MARRKFGLFSRRRAATLATRGRITQLPSNLDRVFESLEQRYLLAGEPVIISEVEADNKKGILDTAGSSATGWRSPTPAAVKP